MHWPYTNVQVRQAIREILPRRNVTATTAASGRNREELLGAATRMLLGEHPDTLPG